MSLARAFLVCVQTVAYQLASTPPNKTPPKARFDTNHPWHVRIATFVFKMQQPLLWFFTAAELLLVAAQQTLLPLPAPLSRAIQHSLCPYPQTLASLPISRIAPYIHATPSTVLGAILVTCGCLLRVTCFYKLGPLFTFDLTIFPSHTLITTGPYAYVRHPAYTGTLLMSLGIILVNFTSGSWITECGILGHGTAGVAVRAITACAWFGWWVSVGIQRCRSEDAELRKIFGKEWDKYAGGVRWWFVPGLV